MSRKLVRNNVYIFGDQKDWSKMKNINVVPNWQKQQENWSETTLDIHVYNGGM